MFGVNEKHKLISLCLMTSFPIMSFSSDNAVEDVRNFSIYLNVGQSNCEANATTTWQSSLGTATSILLPLTVGDAFVITIKNTPSKPLSVFESKGVWRWETERKSSRKKIKTPHVETKTIPGTIDINELPHRVFLKGVGLESVREISNDLLSAKIIKGQNDMSARNVTLEMNSSQKVFPPPPPNTSKPHKKAKLDPPGKYCVSIKQERTKIADVSVKILHWELK